MNHPFPPVSSEDPARPVPPPAGSADSGQAEPPPRLAARNAGVPASPPYAGTPAPRSSGTHHPRPGGVPDPDGGPGASQWPGTGTAPQAPAGDAVVRHPASLAGQDARDAWKAAQSALNAEKRRRRGRYRPKGAAPGYGPGMGRRMPPDGAA